VYVALRDHNWGTVIPKISNLQVEEDQQAFKITFDGICQQHPIDFRWQGEIIGLTSGVIKFSMDGQAHSDFWRNRIGFCVLHPITECAGQPCEIELQDGSRERGVFPQFISPFQPFKGIHAITHQVVPGLYAEVCMTGDTFEMEDQRNWTDASYKTYCTPLDLPIPLLVKRGERIQQQVKLTLVGRWDWKTAQVESSEEIRLSLDISQNRKNDIPIPSLGLGIASHRGSLTPLEIERLRSLNLAHLRVDLWLDQEDWRSELIRGTDQSKRLDCGLEIAIHLSDDPKKAFLKLFTAINGLRTKVVRWIIFHSNETSTNPNWVTLAREILGEFDPSVPFGTGADSNFTELNRDPPSSSSPDFLVFAANPQVHAFDNLSLIENLAGLGETVVNARRLSGGKPVVVSPVTLKPRFNIVATGAENQPDPNELPATVDPRQMTLFGAGWTLGSIKYLSENGINSVTFYETVGWRGLMEIEKGSFLPDKFRSIPGMVFPLYHVFANFAEFADGQVIPSKSSDPLQVDSFAFRKEDQLRVLVANLVDSPSRIVLGNLPEQVGIKTLDETNFMKAVRNPKKFHHQTNQMVKTERFQLKLPLKPYAIVRIDIKGA
jgi:hypothetical protein